MPPSTRKYSPVTYSKPPLETIKPSCSTSLSELIGRMDCEEINLLSESTVLSGVSFNYTESLEPVPPFPRGRKPAVIDFMSLRSNLFHCPRGMPLVSGSSVLSGRGNIVITGPTPPRLKAMLREVVSVKKWRVRQALRPVTHHFCLSFSCLYRKVS
jgi:hypothetical protein